MPEKFFITTAIDYTNAPPHIGHAYEKILADVLARYHRLKGDKVFLLTGVDQHGQKVQQSAEKQGVPPQEFVDGITAKFCALWEKLDVRYDGWAATTDPKHKDCVRAILTRLNAEGQIYKAKRSGYYSVRQEQFLTDKERGADGEFGPEWGQVEFREEENYYFRLAEHRDWLLALIEKRHPELLKQDSQDSPDGGATPSPVHPAHPDNPVSNVTRPLVVPAFRASELYNAVKKLEGDLCISRPKSRLSWGIEFPFDPAFVTYVWFDALVNYLSFAPGYDPAAVFSAQPSEFKDWWRTCVHVIGKDILIPAHGVYWLIMLKALGFTAGDLPALLVHGFWNMAGAKMSKSTGNIVDPDALADKYGAEAVRYYLMSDIATGRDADFSEDRLIQKYNVDLANSLGNLLNRTLSMAAKYREGKIRNLAMEAWGTYKPVPDDASDTVKALGGWDHGFNGAGGGVSLGDFSNRFCILLDTFHACMNDSDASVALFEIAQHVTAANQLVDNSAPWKLAKDPAQAARLDAVLYHLAESLRIIAILISPVLPKAAAGIFAQLNWNKAPCLADATWGGLPDGHQLGKPTPLFPRIETALQP